MVFDENFLLEYRENNRLEVKSAKGGLPQSLWESYSAMANTNGGLILLGVSENKDGTFHTAGLTEEEISRLRKDFWNLANDSNKVSKNILSNEDLSVEKINNGEVLVINIPKANKNDKPIYINNKLFGGTYRRNGEGDYLCSKEEVFAMLRDHIEETADQRIVANMSTSDLNIQSVQAYRNAHRTLKPTHVWTQIDDDEFLEQIGVAIKDDNNKLCLTAAGLLMFGTENKILQVFPEYFLDYRAYFERGPERRWSDRINSNTGEWSGNLYDYFSIVSQRLTNILLTPFAIKGIVRIDESPIHRAVREALVNCLTNADFYVSRGVVVTAYPEKIVFENPGYIRCGKEQMIKGGTSDPRNKIIMKMFNIIGIGERAGSGVPDILHTWKDNGFVDPIIEERFNPDRTMLELSLVKKVDKSNKKKVDKSENKKSDKMERNILLITNYLRLNGESDASSIADYVGLSKERVRGLLSKIDDIEKIGADKNRRYRLKSENKDGK